MLISVLIYFLLAFQVFLLFLLVILISIIGYSVMSVPWVPTLAPLGRLMFKLAELKPGETVVDFGCGDASLLTLAATEFGAKGIGYEHEPFLRQYARWRTRRLKVADRVEVRGDNFFKAKLPPADVIATYLFAETQAKLEPRLREAYPKGTRVVTRTFPYPTLELIKKEVIGKETFYLYRI